MVVLFITHIRMYNTKSITLKFKTDHLSNKLVHENLAREGSANMYIGPEPVLDIFSCYV
jgi:hypothetical protein